MTIRDVFKNRAKGLSSPATGLLDITPSDNADLEIMTRAIMITTAGDVAVVMQDGSTGTIPALQPGVPYPFRIRRILATGTVATGIVGFY